jgi:hypothetical protein
MLVLPDSLEWNRSQGMRHFVPEPLEGEVAVDSDVPLYVVPKVLNKVELAVDFGSHDADIPGFLDSGPLFTEVGSIGKKRSSTAGDCGNVACR